MDQEHRWIEGCTSWQCWTAQAERPGLEIKEARVEDLVLDERGKRVKGVILSDGTTSIASSCHHHGNISERRNTHRTGIISSGEDWRGASTNLAHSLAQSCLLLGQDAYWDTTQIGWQDH